MDDASTRKTLDALADLFLTEAETDPAPSSATDAQSAHTAPVTMRGTPQPVRMPPKTPVAAVLTGGDATEAADATPPLTLRLPRPDPDPDHGRHAGRDEVETIHLEAVLLGNLPVLARPWLTQYAHRISRTRGPVVVLHVDADQIEAELICTTDSPRGRGTDNDDQGSAPPEGASLAAQLQSLAHAKADAATTCLIHLPPPDGDEHQDWILPLQRWTLLCGADEAAIAAAYQLLQKMLERDTDRAQRRIGLAVMGSDEDASLAVTTKLNEAVGRLLATPVELLYSQKQMVPVRQLPIGSYSNSPAQWQELISFLTHAAQGGILDADDAEPPRPQPAVVGRVDATSVRIDHGESQALPDAAGLDADPPPTIQEAGEPVDAAAPITAEQTDGIAMGDGSQTDTPEASTPAPDLLHLIGASHAGAVALEARCPMQPSTQLVLDQNGRLHLLRRQNEDRREDLRSALIELIEARAWVRQHLSILSLTMRQCRFDLSLKPVMHLFTSESKTAASLVGRVGCYVRFHVLQRIAVGEQTTWVSTDLN